MSGLDRSSPENDRVAALEEALALKETQLSASTDENQRLSDLVYETHRRNRQLRNDLDDRFGEIVVLTQLVRDYEAVKNSPAEVTEWACKVIVAIMSTPWWWSLLGAKKRQRRQLANLHRLGLFDAHAYMQLYPDVAAARINPLLHFTKHGYREGRLLTR